MSQIGQERSKNTEKDAYGLPPLSIIPALYFSWIPGVRIVIAFSVGKFLTFEYKVDSMDHAESGDIKF